MLAVLCKTPTKSHVWHISRLSFIITRKWRRSCTQCFYISSSTLCGDASAAFRCWATLFRRVSPHTHLILALRGETVETLQQLKVTRLVIKTHNIYFSFPQNKKGLNLHSFNHERARHVFIIFTHSSNNRWLQFSCQLAQKADVVRNVHCLKVACYVMNPFLRWKKDCIWLIRPCTRYNSCMQ